MKVFDLTEIAPQTINELYRRTIVQGDHMSIARLDLRKGAITRPHRHDNEEVIVLLKGRWFFHFPDKDVVIGPNQVLTITPGVEHSSEVLEDVIAIDVCTPTREDWVRLEDRNLHTDDDQFLWAV